MKKSFVLLLLFLFTLIIFAQKESEEKTHTLSLGLGFGQNYGGIGVNGDYQILSNTYASMGLGYATDISYSFGLKYYLNDKSNSFRPKIVFYYGPNLLLTDYNGRPKQTFYGFDAGIGILYMWGKTKTHGFDIDITYILSSEGIDYWKERVDNDTWYSSDPQKINYSIGYRLFF